MKTRHYCVLAAPLLLFLRDVHAQVTAFTYHGRLADGANLANGNYDLQFDLRDFANGGSSVGPINTLAPVAVSNGLFMVTLDFGPGAFNDALRWLEIGVRTNGSAEPYSILLPRQAVTPAPYATYATASGMAADVVNGAVVKSLNGLRDHVTLVPGTNVTRVDSG